VECPQAFTIDGRWYLTAAVTEERSQRYWTAPRFQGPYTVPGDGGLLAPAGHYAGRVCHWRGLDLLWCWHQTVYDWPGIRNPFSKFLVAPLVLRRRADGSLARHSFPGWAGYRSAALAAPIPAAETAFRAALLPGATWRLSTADGMDVLATTEVAENVWLAGTLILDAPTGGLAFRLDEEGGGYFIEVNSLTAEVTLKKCFLLPVGEGPARVRYHVLQRGHLTQPLTPGEPITFCLISCGPYIECSFGGEVVLATLSAERTRGPVGIWAESGIILATDLLWAPLRVPHAL
jgi:hypothetical protein